MFSTTKNVFGELIYVLQNLPDNSFYLYQVTSLSGASIGQHTRHIIELYQCLLNGYGTGIVNYDDRKRDLRLETDRNAAIEELLFISTNLEQPDRDVAIQYELNELPLLINSNYFREVYYNLEHCIHHQALIKVALVAMNINLVSEQFGVAPSTIQYRK
jgi:hypothetical protein